MTRCKQQDSLLQERREEIRSLEADQDEVSPVVPNEVSRMSAVNGYTRSLGGMEAPGVLVVARIPSAIAPVCVLTSVAKSVLKRAHGMSVVVCISEMACVSASGKLKRRRFQTEDGNGEPNGPLLDILRTAPVSRDAAYEACSAISERPSRVRLRTGKPARERSAYRKRPSRRRLKWRRGLGGFGTRGSPRGCVFGAFRAAYRVFCSQNMRSGFPGREAHASYRLGAWVTSSART